ncbi:cytochrome oxidase small assembly protein [Trinickia terrae]|nr:cytochrome oxidase small assembly protein [Trinickia terrae]
MTRNPQERRTPEQIRASSVRLGLILLAIAAVFFVGIFIKQCYFA